MKKEFDNVSPPDIRTPDEKVGEDTSLSSSEGNFPFNKPIDRSLHVGELLKDKPEALQDYLIAHFGNDFTSWRETQKIDSRVIEIGDEYVKVDCIIDKYVGHFEEKYIKLSLFKYIQDLAPGKLIRITVLELPPEEKIRITDGENVINVSDFEIPELFEGLKDSPMFTKIPSKKNRKH